jgi:hypothetical protein
MRALSVACFGLLAIPLLTIGSGCARTVTTTVTARVTETPRYVIPAKSPPILKTASIVNGPVSFSSSHQYEVIFSITASMSHATIMGSFNLLNSGATAFIDIFPVSDHDTTAVYQSGQISSISVGEPLLPGRYDLMFGTASSIPLQAMASFTLYWDQK